MIWIKSSARIGFKHFCGSKSFLVVIYVGSEYNQMYIALTVTLALRCYWNKGSWHEILLVGQLVWIKTCINMNLKNAWTCFAFNDTLTIYWIFFFPHNHVCSITSVKSLTINNFMVRKSLSRLNLVSYYEFKWNILGKQWSSCCHVLSNHTVCFFLYFGFSAIVCWIWALRWTIQYCTRVSCPAGVSVGPVGVGYPAC